MAQKINIVSILAILLKLVSINLGRWLWHGHRWRINKLLSGWLLSGTAWLRWIPVQLSVHPIALNGCVSHGEGAWSVCLVFEPGPVMHVTVGVPLFTHAVHHTIFELSNVLTLIWPNHLTHTAWLVLFELALVDLASISEEVLATTLKHAVNELTIVGAAIACESALTCFLAIQIVSLVLNFIVIPVLCALPVHLVLKPIAFIETALSVAKCTVSVRHTILPLALVDVSVGVRHSPEALELAIYCLALVNGAVSIPNGANASPLLLPRGSIK